MFDSSSGPGRKPLAATFKADPPQLLPGWEEALETMKMGQTRVIQVPPELAYGDKGVSVTNAAGDTEFLVPPREKLQFELTLKQVGVPPP
jgi:FKBP-type peptidyl-prolyl cis-trans isomerase